jgi:hypothetical protein
MRLQDVVDQALQVAVDGLHNGEPSYSWWEIGRRIDISKQAAQQSWGKDAQI